MGNWSSTQSENDNSHNIATPNDHTIFNLNTPQLHTEDTSKPKCNCGSTMIKSTPSKGYANGTCSKCESCQKSIETNRECWHCPNGYACFFDYCLWCISNGYSINNPAPTKCDTFFLSDRDISIILSYWYRVCIINNTKNNENQNIIILKQNNLPLNIIEMEILPYLYSKTKFKYRINVGLIALNNIDSKLFIKEYKHSMGFYYGLFDPNIVKGQKIGIYDDVDVEFIKLQIQKWSNGLINIKVPMRLTSLADISIAVIVYEGIYCSTVHMIKQIVGQLIKTSDEMYIVITPYSYSKSNTKSAVQPISMKLMLNHLNEMEVDETRINIMNDEIESNKKYIKEMINNAVIRYIKNVEQLYKAF